MQDFINKFQHIKIHRGSKLKGKLAIGIIAILIISMFSVLPQKNNLVLSSNITYASALTNSIPLGTLTQVWNHTFPNANNMGVITNGNYYSTNLSIVDNGDIFVTDNSNNAYCLDASTGETLWTSTLNSTYEEGNNADDSAIVISELANGVIYSVFSDGNVSAISASTGTPLWHSSVNTPLFGSTYGSTFYIDSENGYLYVYCVDGMVTCLDSATGNKIWNYNSTTLGWAPWNGLDSTNPVFSANHVYILGIEENGGQTTGGIYCFDTTQTNIWNVATTPPIWESSTLGYPLIPYGNYVYVNDFYFNNSLDCLDSSTGKTIWNYSVPSGSLNPDETLAIANDVFVTNNCVYLALQGSYGGNVLCLDASTGQLIWSSYVQDLSGDYPSIYVVNGYVYLDAPNGPEFLYCLSGSTGAILCKYTAGVFPGNNGDFYQVNGNTLFALAGSSPSPSSSPSPTATPTQQPTPSPSPTALLTPTPKPDQTPVPTPTLAPSLTPTPTTTPTPEATPTPKSSQTQSGLVVESYVMTDLSGNIIQSATINQPYDIRITIKNSNSISEPYNLELSQTGASIMQGGLKTESLPSSVQEALQYIQFPTEWAAAPHLRLLIHLLKKYLQKVVPHLYSKSQATGTGFNLGTGNIWRPQVY